MRYRITKQYEITGRAYYVAQYLDEKNGLWKSLTQDKVFAVERAKKVIKRLQNGRVLHHY